jgi:hypothetical protein
MVKQSINISLSTISPYNLQYGLKGISEVSGRSNATSELSGASNPILDVGLESRL